MNNILTIKIFGDVEHKYGPYFRIGHKDKEATFNLLDKDRQPIDDESMLNEIHAAANYVGYWIGRGIEVDLWMQLCGSTRDLYLEMRSNQGERDE